MKAKNTKTKTQSQNNRRVSMLSEKRFPIKSKQFDPEQHRIISTDHPDGRYVSTRGLVQYILRNARPELAFNP